MKIKTLKPVAPVKGFFFLLALFFNFSLGHVRMGENINAQQVLLDSHSAANGLTTWNITTSHPNELIIISAGGYGTGGNTLHTTPGTVTVNGNNATYITRGEWLNFNFTWVCEIWAYMAPTPGTYTCSCTEATLDPGYYLNFASSVYQPNCPIGLDLSNIVVGGSDSNHGPTTITASITTTENGSWIYGTIDNNDNGGTGTVAWNGQLTETNYTYSLSNGVDGAQADSTYATAGTYNITSTDIGASNVWMTIALIAVQPNESCCALTDSAFVLNNISCFGQSTGGAYGVPYHGHAPYTYSWAPGGQTTDTITGLSAGLYTVTISDTISCSATATVNITQPSILACTATPHNVACFGDATGSAGSTVTGGTTPYAYSWAPGGQSAATATGLTAGDYSVTVIDANGCSVSAQANITQPAAPLAVTLTGPSIICAGSPPGTLTATASGGTAPYNYSWKGSPYVTNTNSSSTQITPGTQTDTVTVTDANGCKASANITVNLGPSMTVSITGAPSICLGLSTTLCSDIQGGTGGNTYTWQPGNVITPCDMVTPTSTTTYTLTVYDNCGTPATATYTLRVNPLPNTSFSTSLFAGCAPLCVQFYNTTTIAQGKASSYLWTFGNGDSSKVQSPIYCYPTDGKYTIGLTVTSDSGCSATLSKTNLITAFSKPNAAFSYTPQPPTIVTPTVQFVNATTDSVSIIYWAWSFGDNSDSTSHLANPSHTYGDTGTYCVNMIAMDMHGCTDTVTNCLVIEPSFNFYIPSAFTPNGDLKNPTFAPKGQYFKNFEMYIFDRWGMQLYHTTNIDKGWDGTVNGAPAQEDTYIYKITVDDISGHQHSFVGDVTLLK